LVWCNNGLDTVLDAGLQNVVLRELALEVGGQPYPRQRACLRQESLRIEHDDDEGISAIANVLRQAATYSVGGRCK
jgi:hypothetical protein